MASTISPFPPVVSVKRTMLDAARELLIDLERHELTLDDQQAAEPLPSSGSPIEAAVAASSSHSSSDVQRASEHRELLLGQLDRLKESVAQEQTSNRMLRSEKSKLSGDMRTLAQQLKQERAASNAVLAVRMGTEPPTDGSGAAKAEAAHGEHGTGDRGTGGLTLASAASQILMLRREVKWLQKQWQSARRDQDGSANRDQLDSLQQALEAARSEASAADAAAVAGAAQKRLLMRQLGSSRAQWVQQQNPAPTLAPSPTSSPNPNPNPKLKPKRKPGPSMIRWAQQQKRLARRSAAQTEAASLRAQLQAAHEALAAEQQQRKMAMEQLREIREMRTAEGQKDGARAAAAADAASRAAHPTLTPTPTPASTRTRTPTPTYPQPDPHPDPDQASRAAQLIAHRVMSAELGAAEQQAAQQAAQLTALVGAKSVMALRLAQAALLTMAILWLYLPYTMAMLWLYYGYTYRVPTTCFRHAQADEDRAGLTVELSTLRERLAESEERLATLAVGGNGLPPPPSAPAPAPAPAPATSEMSRGLSFKAPKLGKLSKPTLDFKLPGRK